MRSILSAVCLFVLAVSTCWAGTVLPKHPWLHPMQPAANYERFIVRFKANAVEQRDVAARQRLLDFIGVTQHVRIEQLRHLSVGADVIRTDRKLDRDAANVLMQHLAADPRVQHVEIDALRYPTADTYYYPWQWHLWDANGGINWPIGWNGSYGYQAQGNGVVVAVLDTGTTTHPDLAGQFRPGYDFVSDPAMARDGDGRDADPTDMGDWVAAGECNGSNPATNSSWHGTHVAGIIAALTDNGQGVAGVAGHATLLPVRVLGKCGGYDSDITDAIVWASGGSVANAPVNQYPAEVINMSFGGPGACDPNGVLQAAINTAVTNGSVVVAAAGNNAADASGYSPASCANVITVGATNRYGARAGYSNYGAKVAISAPGGDGNDYVYSTYNAGTTVQGAADYAGLQGTSMAAPVVSGVVALMQSLKVNTPAIVRSALLASARPFPSGCTGCGSGIVDAHAAVVAAAPTLSITDVTKREGNGPTTLMTFTATLSQASTQPVTFKAYTSDGTAKAGTDYTALNTGTLTIAPGLTSKSFNVTINGDTVAGPDRAFWVNLTGTTGATPARTYASGTIADDDMSLSINDVAVTEGNSGTKSATFTVSLQRPSALPVSFTVNTADGTATAGSDYTAVVNGVHSIPAGQTSTSVTVKVLGDTTVEPNETFQVNLSNVVGAVLGKGQGIGTIVDDDGGPTISIGDARVVEGNSGTQAMTFTVSLSQAATSAVTYHVTTANGTATANTDYVPRSFDDSIPAGTLSKTFNITVKGDTTLEPDETFQVNLSSSVGASILRGTGTGTIANDDPALSMANVPVNEAGGTANFVLQLSQAAAADVTCTAQTADGTAIAPGDYTARTATLTIPAGQLSASFPVTIKNDGLAEGSETFVVNLTCPTLSNATLTTPQATGTIVDDDPAPVLSVSDVAVYEGGSGTTTQANFTVSLPSPASTNVSFHYATADGTATSASGDYIALVNKTATIPAHQQSVTVPVTINGDNAIEPNETFTLTLSSPVGATLGKAQGVATILNDDGPTLSISDARMAEGNNGLTMMTFNVSLSQPAATDVTFDIATLGTNYNMDSPAVENSDFVPTGMIGVTIPAGQLASTQTFSVPIIGDTTIEKDETFQVGLSNVSGASVYRAQATGTIVNDDYPVVTAGTRSEWEFNYPWTIYDESVTVSTPAPYDITVHVTTSDGTAVAGTDYVAYDAYTTIPAYDWNPQNPVNLPIQIIGNSSCQRDIYGNPWNRYFYINVTPVGVNPEAIGGRGTVTIQEDDCGFAAARSSATSSPSRNAALPTSEVTH